MTLDTKTLDKDGTIAVPLTSAEEPKSTRSIYSAVDLFAGCGGLGTGLDELIARGGTPMPDDGEEAWL